MSSGKAKICTAFLFFLIVLLAHWARDLYAVEIYHDVFTNQEEYQLKKGDQLASLAQRRALRLQVLTKQNKLKNPKPGQTINLNYALIPPHELTDGLVVNLAELAVYHFQNGVFLQRYPLAAGRRNWETPTGTYKILSKVKNPVWRVPNSIQWEMYDRGQEVITEVPPGPKNPLGAFWMATSAEGVGFHATTSPWSVGRYASHGCFRMLPDQIKELFGQIQVGAPVKIIYKPVKLALTADNRIFLEVHGDYYSRVPNFYEAVQTLAGSQLLTDRIDWARVRQVIKAREGVAEDVTKNTVSAAAPVATPESKERDGAAVEVAPNPAPAPSPALKKEIKTREGVADGAPKNTTSAAAPAVKKASKARRGVVVEAAQNTTSIADPLGLGSRLYSGEVVHKSLGPANGAPLRPDPKKKSQSGS